MNQIGDFHGSQTHSPALSSRSNNGPVKSGSECCVNQTIAYLARAIWDRVEAQSAETKQRLLPAEGRRVVTGVIVVG